MERQIFVQNLNTYNNGILDGKWYTLSDYSDPEELIVAVREANQPHGEWAIHDSIGFPPALISEYTPLSVVFAWHEAFYQADNEDAFAAFLLSRGTSYYDPIEALEEFSECFQGTAGSVAEFAEEFATEMGCLSDVADSILVPYINWEAFWEGELRFDYGYQNYKGILYFFRSE